ncbi:MAG: permease, partial [Bdellovibrio sp. CG_4_9_14_3_um_filter_39_7]
SGTTQLILFAIIMLLASYYMLKKKKVIEGQMEETVHLPILKIAGLGLVVGIVTGLVGVGGGFLIVPALHLMARVPMKQAVGTSLVIIAANSFSGYLGYMNQVHLDWNFIGMFILFTAIGIIIGSWLVKFVPADKLKKAFGVFLIIMGLFILYKERAKMGIAYLPTQIGRTLA